MTFHSEPARAGSTETTMNKPLSHLRVVDLSRILAGPWATQNLADLGAEVIKIEKPGVGDDTRQMGPPFLADERTGEDGDAAYFMSCNRGKKSVAVDFSDARGQRIVRDLARGADVFVENYKVGALRKYGLDYDSLREINPQLVYCSVTGFGQTGPYKDRAGYDYLIQGMGGLMSVTGERDDLPGGGPQRAGVAVADLLAGMYATTAILAALRHRDRGHGGQHIDISLLDCMVGSLVNQSMNYLVSGQVPQRMGSGHPNIAPYAVYPAADGHLVLAVGNDTQFRRLCEAVGQAEVGTDPRFATIAARVRNRAEMDAWLVPVTRSRSLADWTSLLERAQVPGGPINRMDQVFADEHVVARGMRAELRHPRYGRVPTVRNPMRFSATPLEPGSAPPLLGEHTDEVLRSVGVTPEQLAALREAGVL
ncbi:CaiB/BaiF CoA transferase family protein [Pigmentiphaga kullae]|uniref:Crotonobetainyl-CoA:carnitine CoA-transferase CaiB-like acyl-CoA transferase n=1 Tax=Pigmentiphaga kullae TaxID=151784 RepID=A0A4Q7NCV8_9BURK|nr:CaiB/BaiF CoA-transferase family protein [Pigmentiphaga kullae]RZS80816.1 crotonobetainyl-CoA:carnitine CoA-transferase CaiB-like acyl-CoA transferase [Pigmentiphaga kullae]